MIEDDKEFPYFKGKFKFVEEFAVKKNPEVTKKCLVILQIIDSNITIA